MLISTRPATAPKKAVALLRADHKLVSYLFAEYEATRVTAKKKQLAPASR